MTQTWPLKRGLRSGGLKLHYLNKWHLARAFVSLREVYARLMYAVSHQGMIYKYIRKICEQNPTPLVFGKGRAWKGFCVLQGLVLVDMIFKDLKEKVIISFRNPSLSRDKSTNIKHHCPGLTVQKGLSKVHSGRFKRCSLQSTLPWQLFGNDHHWWQCPGSSPSFSDAKWSIQASHNINDLYGLEVGVAY